VLAKSLAGFAVGDRRNAGISTRLAWSFRATKSGCFWPIRRVWSRTHTDGFSYSWFCERYKELAGRLKPTLRQVHVAGEKPGINIDSNLPEAEAKTRCST
jgi:hypothetical protein